MIFAWQVPRVTHFISSEVQFEWAAGRSGGGEDPKSVGKYYGLGCKKGERVCIHLSCDQFQADEMFCDEDRSDYDPTPPTSALLDRYAVAHKHRIYRLHRVLPPGKVCGHFSQVFQALQSLDKTVAAKP